MTFQYRIHFVFSKLNILYTQHLIFHTAVLYNNLCVQTHEFRISIWIEFSFKHYSNKYIWQERYDNYGYSIWENHGEIGDMQFFQNIYIYSKYSTIKERQQF